MTVVKQSHTLIISIFVVWVRLIMSRRILFLILIAATLTMVALLTAYSKNIEAYIVAINPVRPSSTNQYVVLAWNDLGMHCYNPSFENIAILPPYNTLWAQVIKVGNPPTLVTTGINVYYSVPGNTYSVANPPFTSKTDFWEYCPDLFNTTLPNNVGLAGKGLYGKMDLAGDHFEAKGIPLTEYLDRNAFKPNMSSWVASHFQLAFVVVTDAKTGRVLAQTSPVAPLSTELNCVNCHSDTGDATTRYPIDPTGKVETNILAMHDYLNPQVQPPLSQRQPVLCADCHGSNALGLPEIQGIKNLSSAIHGHHYRPDIMDITPDTNGCYQCHPGPETQCLRDTMSQNFGFSCVDCHGNIGVVANNTDPWLNEPRCDNPNCHGAGYEMNNPLYRFSTGHGNLYCEGCHGSTHSVSPSRELNDDLRFIALQGTKGPLKKCTVCHSTMPETAFKHRLGVTYANETSAPASISAGLILPMAQPPTVLPQVTEAISASLIIGAFGAVSMLRKRKLPS